MHIIYISRTHEGSTISGLIPIRINVLDCDLIHLPNTLTIFKSLHTVKNYTSVELIKLSKSEKDARMRIRILAVSCFQECHNLLKSLANLRSVVAVSMNGLKTT